MNHETSAQNDIGVYGAYTSPLRIAAYEKPKSLPGKVVEAIMTATYLNDNMKHIFLGRGSGYYYTLKELSGFDRAEILNNRGVVTYVDKYDGRKVDVHISRAAGDFWDVTGIKEHVVKDGHNGTLKPLSKLELLVK